MIESGGEPQVDQSLYPPEEEDKCWQCNDQAPFGLCMLCIVDESLRIASRRVKAAFWAGFLWGGVFLIVIAILFALL